MHNRINESVSCWICCVRNPSKLALIVHDQNYGFESSQSCGVRGLNHDLIKLPFELKGLWVVNCLMSSCLSSVHPQRYYPWMLQYCSFTMTHVSRRCGESADVDGTVGCRSL